MVGMGLGSHRLRMLLLGVGVTIAFVAGAALVSASYLGVVSSDHRAQVRLLTVGDSLGIGSDVKFRGLRVGRVLAVTPGESPVADVVISKRYADQIPGDVQARLLPGTLFGNEYVDLVVPAGSSAASSTAPSASSIEDVSVIAADRSAQTLRLMDTLESTQRLLVAVDPGRLDAAVSAVAAALDGRGDDLNAFIADSAELVGHWQDRQPVLFSDLDLLATDLGTLADVEPELVAAVRSSVPLARTIAAQEQSAARLLRDGRTLLADGRRWLDGNLRTLAGVLRGTAATLTVFAARHERFEELLGKVVPVVENGAAAVDGNRIRMNAALELDFPDAYDAGDCPRYGSLRGPNCPGGAR